MLERVEKVLQAWEQEGVEAALALNLPLPTAQQLEASLSALSSEDHRRLMLRLDDFAAAILQYKTQAEAEIKEVMQDLDRAQIAVNACMSYNTRQKDV